MNYFTSKISFCSLKPSAEKAANERANLMKQELGKKLMDTQKQLAAQEQQYET